ncbi:hypothetical protein BDV18DRAFT_13106 [Aspergillus unguis]
MGPGLEISQPLNARRPAAPQMPALELPPPNFLPTSLKYPTQAHSLHHLPLPNSVTGSAQGSDGATTTSGAGRQPFTPGLGSSYSNRDPFSPSLNPPLLRNPTSSPGETYDMSQQLPPFQIGTGPPAHPHPHPMLSSHPLPSNDPYMPKASSAPAYGAVQQMSSPGYQSFPSGAPLGAPPPMHLPPRIATNPPNYSRQPWPSYSLPAMPGPVMSNVHSPGGQMSMINPLHQGLLPGFNSGHLANMQQMYGGHPPHPMHGSVGPTNDRPFKCDKCPQSFNRNHDLKRHSRIHLAVKPYPCTNCDKQFSRKDALKRHQLVKGCKDELEKTVKVEDRG